MIGMIDVVQLRSVFLEDFVKVGDEVGRDFGVLRIEIGHVAAVSYSAALALAPLLLKGQRHFFAKSRSRFVFPGN